MGGCQRQRFCGRSPARHVIADFRVRHGEALDAAVLVGGVTFWFLVGLLAFFMLSFEIAHA